jgi:phosphoribosylamine--glycine ligase
VVIAAEGYPASPVKGDRINVPHAMRPHSYVLHGGTALGGDGALVSAGGRVLNAVGTGPDLAAARTAAYDAAARITMRGSWYRHDIAQLAARLRLTHDRQVHAAGDGPDLERRAQV